MPHCQHPLSSLFLPPFAVFFRKEPDYLFCGIVFLGWHSAIIIGDFIFYYKKEAQTPLLFYPFINAYVCYARQL